MDRRHFLAASCLGGWGVAAALAQAQPAQRMSLGFSLYGMRSLPLSQALKACAVIGYTAVELACLPDWPADPKKLTADDRRQLRRQLIDLNLQVPALMENLPLTNAKENYADRLKRAAELAHQLSPERPPLLETVLGGSPNQWERLRAPFTSTLQSWTKVLDSEKLTLAIKPHRLQALHDPSEAAKLLQAIDSPRVKLAYDWSHFEQRGFVRQDTLKSLLPRTVFIHVKDTILEHGKVRFVLPGEGSTNYRDYLRELQSLNYAGCVCVEVSAMVSNTPSYDGIAAAKKCYQAMKAVWPRS